MARGKKFERRSKGKVFHTQDGGDIESVTRGRGRDKYIYNIKTFGQAVG